MNTFVGNPPSDMRFPYCKLYGTNHRQILGDYCDVYLTHDSMSVRKAHNSGRNHIRNVINWYQGERRHTLPVRASNLNRRAEIGHEKAQTVIDSITSSYADAGQANPLLQQPGVGGFPPPPMPGFPGMPPPAFMQNGANGPMIPRMYF